MGKLGVREKSLIHQVERVPVTPVPGFGTSFLPFAVAEDTDDRGDSFPLVTNFTGKPPSTTTVTNLYAFPSTEADDGEQGVPGGVGNFGGSSGGSVVTNNVTNNYIATAQEPDDPVSDMVSDPVNFGGAQLLKSSDALLLQRGYYASSTSGTATYTATLAPAPIAYEDGMQYAFTATATNSGNAPTINFNGLGALTLKLNGVSLSAGQLVPGATYQGIKFGSTLVLTSVGGTTFVYPSATSLLYGWSDSDDFVAQLPCNIGANSLTNRSLGSKTTYDSTTAGSPTVTAFVEKGHPGSFTSTVGTGSLEFDFAASGTNTAVGTLGLDQGGGSDNVIYFKTDATLSSGTMRYVVNGGWSSQNGANTVIWRYTDNTNSGAFTIAVTVNSVSQTGSSGSTTVLASTWYRMRLNINAAYNAINLYISVGTVSGGVTTWGAEYLDCTYSGTMPVNTSLYYGKMQLNRISGTGNASVNWDGWEYSINLAGPRGG